MKNLDHYLEEAIGNIREDRGITRDLLDDVVRLIGKDEEHHKYVGTVAAKYVEPLQRSNEQLVKISTLIHKQQSGEPGLSDTDKAEIFDLLQNAPEEEVQND